ncbi:uncharacterized protein LOC126382343 [Pectinophora gossypiella]|uniref:uncharacterized protein LOC126382343 n=1 Tax=Pectinophora gossypiella TaxID=13191 RepID=UPI00214F1191|nr:uncharacterized protein LOC126382343 [Pectinophora gossypiella]
MSEVVKTEAPSTESEMPVPPDDDKTKFPPFPDPTDTDFDDDILEEERSFYTLKFPDLNEVKSERLHCTACDRHLGCSMRNETRMRSHPLLRTLTCHACHTFYNSGEFEKGDDGSELYCRWCGQGGQVYCCSDCPHVFCAKCIKRNFGMPKIKEIENTDDWKCFKCNPKCLWDLRAVCWALLRFCDLRNKLILTTQDEKLKQAYQDASALDDSTCCKHKKEKRKERELKKKEMEESRKTAATLKIIPPTIQVKKFASINLDESPKEKKAQKRPISPKAKPILIKTTPVSMPSRLLNPVAMPPMTKKIRMVNPPVQPIAAVRIQPKNIANLTYARIKPKPPQMPMTIINNMNNYNGYNNTGILNNMLVNDNINLSLENLTQGLDMSAVASSSNLATPNDVVCTPDFPLEPLCEVTEENNDDDVECITPAPPLAPVSNIQPQATSRYNTMFNDLSSDNIIQMTENDVTVNAATGGLKFRVDPQTLSSNKMYRLPDGRIFAINANPNMPGGYSATIVALTDASKGTPKGSIYAAKINTSPSAHTAKTPSPTPRKVNRQPPRVQNNTLVVKQIAQPSGRASKSTKDKSPRRCDLNVPIEWYRYNLIDAVDALEYSLARLQKLKKEATTVFLRTRNVDEMRSLHKSLDRLLNTSATRFNEIRDNLHKEMKQYVIKKTADGSAVSDDDDDVEILNDTVDEPIFIDENSMESNNANESQANHEVDLTGAASSEHNDSGEKSIDSFDRDPLDETDRTRVDTSIDSQADESTITKENEDTGLNLNGDNDNKSNDCNEEKENDEQSDKDENLSCAINGDVKDDDEQKKRTQQENDEINKPVTEEKDIKKEDEVNDNDKNIRKEDEEDQGSETDEKGDIKEMIADVDLNDDKTQDTEMTEELIENLLKDDTGGGESDSQNLNSMDISDVFNES